MDSSHLSLSALRRALQQPLPGRPAQLSMAVRPRPGDLPDLPNPCPREAAVLILLYIRHGQLVLPLTLRTETLQMHRGQISLPGGASEPQDQNLTHTALRETCEELGIPEDEVEVLGALSPLYVPPSRFCVHPHVGHLSAAPVLRPDPQEVARVIEAPLEQLLQPETRQEEVRWREGQRFQVPMYVIGGNKVWGATAMILGEFVAVLKNPQDPLRGATEREG
jgi:8-oxo-dGTP pyrophosphatase MutT (NUDIX family)